MSSVKPNQELNTVYIDNRWKYLLVLFIVIILCAQFGSDIGYYYHLKSLKNEQKSLARTTGYSYERTKR